MARPIFDLLRNTSRTATSAVAPITAVTSFCSIDTTAERFEGELSAWNVELFGDHRFVLAAEHQFSESDQEQRDSDRCHEQNHIGLVDERA